MEKTLRDRKLAILWVTHSDEQERRVAVRTIHLGPREGGGNIVSRNTGVSSAEIDGADTASTMSGDSALGALRKKKSGVRRTRSESQSSGQR